MPSIGEEMLIRQYGTRLGVAEAFILGKFNAWEEDHALGIITPNLLLVARIRLESLGLLNEEHIQRANSSDEVCDEDCN